MSLYTYPSNKLEYLVQVLSKLLDVEEKNIFTPTQLVVGSRGMQHWLSMQLAENRNIAMNLKYDMINGYIMDICYQLTGNQEHKKAYTKDILTWRIFKSLDSIDCDKLQKYCEDSDLKKYQLSVKIAETFSKYLAYRVDWLQGWEKGVHITPNTSDEDEIWKMQLWQVLVTENPKTPYAVQLLAKQKFSKISLQNIGIPNDIYIFGINTISPKNLDFLFELARYININILYINPCSEYWGDLKSKNISAWLGNDDYELQPLLANFGLQGREFINTLIETPTKQEFEIFENSQKLVNCHQSQLVSLQRNLLELDCQNHSQQKDLSISINSCHSPLREVQVLHDRLLDMIKQNPNIKPRDILVMCPNIEDYAPYIDSVFSHFGEEESLPCSIADRTLLDAEPIVASFIDLLKLPESDFEVNKIFDYLSVPAIQKKFAISDEQLETIRYWLGEACIHHSNDGKTFSWSWGLKRLMLGFSYSDSEYIVDDSFMTIPAIEGSEIVELGGLYELLEQLSEYSEELLEPRSFEQWQDYLLEIFDNVFDVTSEGQHIAKKIKDIIAKTIEPAKEIMEDINVDLYTIRNCLISQLSEPIINNHFLNGKVTFCSMTPMRNVPFKVVAMLGLNNGKFPRQESIISFDLMNRLGRRVGDRTKRDDDRYLFLEAILSAREYLYISYIGKSIKNNTEQQASLTLKEFIGYLQEHYDWQDIDIKNYPLHAFSENCYANEYQSYDEAWLKLLQIEPEGFYSRHNNIKVADNEEYKLPQDLVISKLVKIFENPLKAYANYTLDLYLEDNIEELEDSEPFDINSLEKYKLKQKLLDDLLNEENISLTLKKSKLSGKFPESILTDEELDIEVEKLQRMVEDTQVRDFEKKYFEIDVLGIRLSNNCYVKDEQVLLLYNSTKLEIRHKFELYLSILLVSAIEKKDFSGICYCMEKDQLKPFEIKKTESARARQMLEHYVREAIEVVNKPKLVYLSLAEALMGYVKESPKKDAEVIQKSSRQKQEAWDKVISTERDYKSLDKDAYFKLFYNQSPTIGDFEGEDVYKSFFEMLDEL